jgi:hypothetical protein
LGSTPRTVSLRVRYRTPLTAMLRSRRFIGGERGLAFTLNDSTGVVTLREGPTPELDRVPNYALGEDHPGAYKLARIAWAIAAHHTEFDAGPTAMNA